MATFRLAPDDCVGVPDNVCSIPKRLRQSAEQLKTAVGRTQQINEEMARVQKAITAIRAQSAQAQTATAESVQKLEQLVTAAVANPTPENVRAALQQLATSQQLQQRIPELQARETTYQGMLTRLSQQVEQTEQLASRLSLAGPEPALSGCATPIRESGTPQQRLERMRAIYLAPYRFLRWVVEQAPTDDQLNSARVYVTAKLERQMLERLLGERDPVNIAQRRLFDQQALQSCFLYSQSFYQTFWEDSGKTALAPNFSLYTRATLAEGFDRRDWSQCQNLAGVKGGEQAVHLLHAIGLAFDSEEQPDYQYYIAGQRQDQIAPFYWQLFAQVFQCANDLFDQGAITGVAMSMVGAKSFAELYPGGPTTFQQQIWVPLFIEARRRLFSAEVPVIIAVASLGEVDPAVRTALQSAGIPVEERRFPQSVAANPLALYVNAWDPHSMIGNGNCADQSLDGYVGRSTNAVAIGWPGSNPALVGKEPRLVAVGPMPEFESY